MDYQFLMIFQRVESGFNIIQNIQHDINLDIGIHTSIWIFVFTLQFGYLYSQHLDAQISAGDRLFGIETPQKIGF